MMMGTAAIRIIMMKSIIDAKHRFQEFSKHQVEKTHLKKEHSHKLWQECSKFFVNVDNSAFLQILTSLPQIALVYHNCGART